MLLHPCSVVNSFSFLFIFFSSLVLMAEDSPWCGCLQNKSRGPFLHFSITDYFIGPKR